MIRFVSVFFIAFTHLTLAQTEDLNVRDPRLQEGKLFTVILTPASRELTVSFAGKPQVEIGPNRVIVFGRERLPNGSYRELTIRPSGENFKIIEPVDLKRAVEIEIRDRSNKNRKETLTIGPKD